MNGAQTITGWLFDAYPVPGGIVVWFIDGDGAKHRLLYPFAPSFFLHLDNSQQRRAMEMAGGAPSRLSFRRTERTEIYSGDPLPVLEVVVHDPTRLKRVVAFYERFFPHFAFYNSDILPEQLFFYATDLFPLAYGDYTCNGRHELTGWTLHDDRTAVEYTTPPLSIMLLRTPSAFVPPKHRKTFQLELSYDNRSYVFEHETPQEMLHALNRHLDVCDPDIVLTEYGDSLLLPRLTHMARQENIPMHLNRDAAAGYKTSKESSFFQYGKVVHKDGAFELRGRWHVDAKNSFTVIESTLEGLYEIVRVTQLSPQHQARASIGTGLSSLQLSWAYRHGILIPSKKREPEEFKSASLLLLADRGGLIYYPPPGYHEEVAELDFVSMYPSIMVNHNVSPETINCRCCGTRTVPELGYAVCDRREGIVAATLRPVVAKRAYYKKKKKEYKGRDPLLFAKYDSRQNALKWMLVSCFGYLGYKNARFGRIEAHESVNAFSRDAILTAKEVAEEQGYRLLHAIIDCVWLKKEGATEPDYQRLCAAIAARVGIDISLEGIYDWILFPASKQDALLPTGTRYVGHYRHGEMKMRGIEARRHDTPRFLAAFQQSLLDVMAGARTAAEIRALLPSLLDATRGHLERLRAGAVHPLDLVVRRHISREASEYSTNTIAAQVTAMLEESGIHLAAGEAIEYIVTDAGGRNEPFKAKPLALYAFEDGYDRDHYTELLFEAAATLLQPFGYDVERLRDALLPPAARPQPRPRRTTAQTELFTPQEGRADRRRAPEDDRSGEGRRRAGDSNRRSPR